MVLQYSQNYIHNFNDGDSSQGGPAMHRATDIMNYSRVISQGIIAYIFCMSKNSYYRTIYIGGAIQFMMR